MGPESAGAHPGPVCYRKGGHAAITDANLVLGRILPKFFPRIFGPKARMAFPPFPLPPWPCLHAGGESCRRFWSLVVGGIEVAVLPGFKRYVVIADMYTQTDSKH